MHELDGEPGLSLMELAVANDVDGIDADCRGSCACATCHVHVAALWRGVVGAAGEIESEMLSIAEHVGPESRLACQIRLTAALDGLEVRVPQK